MPLHNRLTTVIIKKDGSITNSSGKPSFKKSLQLTDPPAIEPAKPLHITNKMNYTWPQAEYVLKNYQPGNRDTHLFAFADYTKKE